MFTLSVSARVDRSIRPFVVKGPSPEDACLEASPSMASAPFRTGELRKLGKEEASPCTCWVASHHTDPCKEHHTEGLDSHSNQTEELSGRELLGHIFLLAATRGKQGHHSSPAYNHLEAFANLMLAVRLRILLVVADCLDYYSRLESFFKQRSSV